MIYSGPARLTYNGVDVLQSESVELSVDTGNKDVDTMHLGRAGHSRGSKKIMLSVKNAIPIEGFEIDWISLANEGLEVQLGLRIGLTKSYGFIGDIRTARLGSGVDGTNELSFEYHGKIVAETG
jgi:hypothetical protein